MRRLWRMLLAGLLAFGVLAPLNALSDPVPDEVEANRVRLMKLRDDPDAYSALLGKTAEFLRLPEERRAQLVRLDQELRQLEPAKRERLKRVLKRYAAWQRRLGDADRQRLHDAPDGAARLDVLRGLREGDWMSRFPKAQRERLARLPTRERADAIRKFRQRQKRQKEEWHLAFRFWDDLMKKAPLPTKLAEMPQDVQSYFHEYLSPRLKPDELAILAKAEGRWPDYPRTLVEIADRHPLALPGETGPKRLSELPESLQTEFRRRIRKARPKIASDAVADKQIAKQLRVGEDKWPGFGTAVSEFSRRFFVKLPHEMWPARYVDLSPGVRQFIENRLKPLLTPAEQQTLNAAADAWPRFPVAIQELADKHGLHVPWQSLPGPPEQWNKYRFDQPAPTSLLWLTPRAAAAHFAREP